MTHTVVALRRVGLALLLLSAGVAGAAGQKTGESGAALQERQAQARAQQEALRGRIEALQKQIDSQEATRRDAASALKESESAISDVNRKLEDLAAQRRQAEAQLRQLDKDIVAGKKTLASRQAELAQQLRAQYASGLSPWTALLSGDDPQAIGRDLSYLSYVAQAQADAVRAVRDALDELARMQQQAQARRTELTELAQQTEQEKAQLQKHLQERQRVLERVSAELRAQRSQAATLQRDEKRLGSLVSGLETAIAEQLEREREAERARRAEQARRAQEAREAARQAQRAAREAQELARRERDAQAARQAREQVEQARAQEREAERLSQQAQAEPAPAPAHGLRKGLPYPVRGEVQGRFGAERPDGGVWRGIVLRAPEGTPVKSIAPGRVVYANWLKGFGNIIIVDHGDKYLSVYAYNQSLLGTVGQQVGAGQAIATVGATGGQVESGLYFEIRHEGTPVNPLLWLVR